MILLVDHEAHLLHAVDRHAAGALGVGMLPADQLPLHEKLAVDLLEMAHVDVFEPLAHGHGRDPLAEEPLDVGTILLGGTAHEGVMRDVAGEPHAAAHDDVRFRAGAAKPLADRLRQRFEFHSGFFSMSPDGGAAAIQRSSSARMASLFSRAFS